MLNVSGIIVDCEDVPAVSRFWASALGFEVASTEDFAWLEIPNGATGIAFQQVDERKVSKNRLHLDLTPRNATQEDEVERLLGLGATRVDVGQPADARWVVLADPEGNEFCVLAATD